MPSRNIAVQKDVYDALEREKRPRESFTKLFVRLLHQRGPLEELSGSWSTVGRTAQRQWKALRGTGGRR
ncbi:MAG TPA: antitoxin VapB family protein [Thermoplasmata archaeon]|nr:antitoxin VapB family protein [Thermoplasmata archaeon]